MQATQKAKTRRVDDPTMTDFNFFSIWDSLTK